MLSNSWRIADLFISSTIGGRRFWGAALATDPDGTAINPPLEYRLGLSRRSPHCHPKRGSPAAVKPRRSSPPRGAHLGHRNGSQFTVRHRVLLVLTAQKS